MAIFVVLLKTHAGTAAAHYVEADEHRVFESGGHGLYISERLVWQGTAHAVRDVKRFDDRAEAKHWHKYHRVELAADEMSYRHEHGTGDGASPFIGGVQLRIGSPGKLGDES
ncbi:MAG: hypothetical protein KC502_20780 [Myxococcales bacterium]|nr:hypothetical protein [Myxococcales bacterium]